MERLEGIPDGVSEEQVSEQDEVVVSSEPDWTPILEAAKAARPEWEREQTIRIREMQRRAQPSDHGRFG